KNAFQHIGSALGRLFNPTRAPNGHTDARHRRIYWTYGILAALYSGWLLAFILVSLGAFLVGRYQAWGGFFFAAFVTVIFRGPIGKAGRLVASLFSGSSNIMGRMKRLARWAAFLGLIAAGLYFISIDFKISGQFTLLPIPHANV